MAVRKIAKRHLETLSESAITETAAMSWGILSAHEEDDLPADLRSNPTAVRSLPGIVFPLRHLDGTLSHQLRPDTPLQVDGGGERKYIQAAGIGSIINVPETMAPRLTDAKTVLIVEGTKQTIAVSQYVSPDTLVVGVQGSSNWSHDGVPVDDLIQVCSSPTVTRCEILFDADVAKNPNVWDSAKRIQAALRVNAGVPDVAFVRMMDGGYGGKSGIDDALGARAEAERAPLLARLRAEATAKLGRRPAAKKAASSGLEDVEYEVRMDEGRIVTVTKIQTGDTLTATKFGAAARIVAVESVEDEVDGRFNHVCTNLVLEVAVSQPDGRVVLREHTIDDGKLEKVNDWLSELGAVAVHVERLPKPSDQIEVANIIRSQSEGVELSRRIQHLGWVFDETGEKAQWRWLHTRGGIGATDVTDTIKGVPAATLFQSINLPDPCDLTEAQIVDAVRQFIGVRDLIEPAHKLAWDAAIGAYGLAFLPVLPMTALAYFGAHSTGKSTLAQALAATLSYRWRPTGTPMMTFNSTTAAMDIAASGVENCFLHVDDLKPERDRNRRAQVLDMLDGLLRRAHGSGSRARGGLGTSGRGDIVMRERSDSAPLLIVTGEEIPTGGEFAESGLDRMFIIQVPNGGMLRRREVGGVRDDGSASLNELKARVEVFPRVTTAYTRWLAALIYQYGEDSGDQRSAREELTRLVENTTKEAVDLIGAHEVMANTKVSNRAQLAAARLMSGAAMFLGFATDIGALTAERADEIAREVRAEIATQAVRTTREVMSENDDRGQSILESLRSEILSGRATVEANEAQGSCIRIGATGTAKLPETGQRIEVVNLFPEVVNKVTRYATGKSGVIRDLAPYALPGNNGTVLRNVTVDKVGLRAVTIPMSIWNDKMSTEADDDYDQQERL